MKFILLINVKMPTVVDNCWHYNIYSKINAVSGSSETGNVVIFQHFSFYEELPAQLS